jgi:hypothetical protein
MPEFSVTDEKIAHISAQFQVRKSHVEEVHQIFSDVTDGVKNQYFAHIIRCMESYIRNKTGNPMFQINTFPIDPDSPALNVGCAQYYPKRYFSIFNHHSWEEIVQAFVHLQDKTLN